MNQIMTWRSNFLGLPRNVLCAYFVLILALNSYVSGTNEAPGELFLNMDFDDQLSAMPDNYHHICEAFFLEYIAAAGNFTHCELLHAKPFRICTKCFEPYAIMKSLYQDLTTDPKLHHCMIKYLKSDRVQIIPTVQRSAESLWETSSCNNCVQNLKVDERTKEVKFTVPKDVHKFMSLYFNISDCLMGNLTMAIDVDPMVQNISVLCKVCDDNYQHLNDHYIGMANNANGDVCMDVVDMMNYTRVTWSVDLNCSHRSADAASVIIITLAVAISPLFFYLPLRYTSKEKIKTVFKQKRYEGFVSSASASYAEQDSSPSPARRLTPMAS